MDVAEIKIRITQDVNDGLAGLRRFEDQVTKTTHSIETLRAKLLVRQQLLIEEKDISKIVIYNREIEILKNQIGKLENAGKQGFDVLGNAVERSTGGFTKAYSGLRQIANILPGIGIGGLVAFAIQPIISYIHYLTEASASLNLASANLQNLNEVMADANKHAGEEIADLKILYKAATDVNLTMQERLSAVKALQTEFPDYFGNINKETILNGGAKASYDALTLSILGTSRAKAAKDKIDDLEAKRLDIAFQKQKILIATTNELNAAKDKSVKSIAGVKSEFGSPEEVIITKKQQGDIIEARRDAALKVQDINDRSLQSQEDFLIKFAGLGKIAKTIEDGIKTPKVKDIHVKPEKIIIDKPKKLEFEKGLTEEFTTKPIRFQNSTTPFGGGLPQRGAAPTIDPSVLALANLIKLQQEARQTAQVVSGIVSPAFDALFQSIVDGSGNAFEAFGNALVGVLKQLTVTLLKTAALAGILSLITGGSSGLGFSGIFKNLLGGKAFDAIPHADGGIFTRPTLLGNHLFGEAGPEAIVPLKQFSQFQGGSNRSETIIPDVRIQGNDLVILFDRATARRGRNG